MRRTRIRRAVVLGLAAPGALAAAAAAQCELSPILPSAPMDDAFFGAAVALDGTAAVVATAGSVVLPRGDVRVYERALGGWTEVALLTSPSVLPDTSYGFAVGLDGNLALVGAPSGGAFSSGAVHAFERGPSGWVETDVLVPSLPPFSLWGGSIDVQGDRAVVGSVGFVLAPGVALVLDRGPGGWTPTAQLASDAPAPGDEFGRAVALDGSRVLVGAPGVDPAVHVWELGPGGWARTAKIASPAPGESSFGISVDLDGGRALIGDPGGQTPSGEPGTTYVFELSGSDWVETALLRDPEVGGAGSAVAWCEGKLLSAAPYGSQNRVLVYSEAPSGWVQTGTLTAPQPASGFGRDLAVSGGRVLAGAALFDGAGETDSGAVLEWSVEALCSPVESISLAAGGAQPLALDAGPQHPLGIHLLLGSAIGTVPGLDAGGTTIPLNVDGYFLYTLLQPNGPVLSGSLGLLDGLGGSSAPAFALPPGLAGLAGVTLHHAFVVLDLGPSPAVSFASNALPVALVP